jgi:hypothetical protein
MRNTMYSMRNILKLKGKYDMRILAGKRSCIGKRVESDKWGGE